MACAQLSNWLSLGPRWFSSRREMPSHGTTCCISGPLQSRTSGASVPRSSMESSVRVLLIISVSATKVLDLHYPSWLSHLFFAFLVLQVFVSSNWCCSKWLSCWASRSMSMSSSRVLLNPQKIKRLKVSEHLEARRRGSQHMSCPRTACHRPSAGSPCAFLSDYIHQTSCRNWLESWGPPQDTPCQWAGVWCHHWSRWKEKHAPRQVNMWLLGILCNTVTYTVFSCPEQMQNHNSDDLTLCAAAAMCRVWKQLCTSVDC